MAGSTTATPTTSGPNAQSDRSPVVEIRELSQALKVETLPVLSPTRQVDATATSSISEKGPQEAAAAAAAAAATEPAVSTAPQPTSPATTTSASVSATDGGAGGHVRQRVLLRATDNAKQFLPGQPRVSLNPKAPTAALTFGRPLPPSRSDTTDYVLQYLRESHLTTELDELLPYMKYIFVQTPSHRHIMPLHHQKSHGREVIVDEHPGLHLVWYYERIFVKPIPAYMYSQAFWTYIADADPALYQASLGFIRTYHYLIKYEIDFNRACELGLIPKKPCTGELPTYEEICDFLGSFWQQVRDKDVSRRFRYGELRLTRINKTTMLFKFQLAYFQIQPQWGSYLSHILAPIITIFAIMSVILNALQVTLAARDVKPDTVTGNWMAFIDVALYLPVAVMLLIGALLAATLLGVVGMFFKDLIWAKTVRHRRKQGDMQAGEKSYGIIW